MNGISVRVTNEMITEIRASASTGHNGVNPLFNRCITRGGTGKIHFSFRSNEHTVIIIMIMPLLHDSTGCSSEIRTSETQCPQFHSPNGEQLITFPFH